MDLNIDDYCFKHCQLVNKPIKSQQSFLKFCLIWSHCSLAQSKIPIDGLMVACYLLLKYFFAYFKISTFIEEFIAACYISNSFQLSSEQYILLRQFKYFFAYFKISTFIEAVMVACYSSDTFLALKSLNKNYVASVR